MLVFQIFYKGKHEDDIFITGETLQEIRTKTEIAIKERGWERKNCWSERIECKEAKKINAHKPNEDKEEESTDKAIDNQGDIDDDFEERSEGIERFGGRPLTDYF